jgi:predicted AlkP superfamily pyrophosphatase or phosphodiesterase
VILVSWDGVRPDYLDRDAHTPALDRLRRSGTEAERLIPVSPSKTFPNHVSLATGTYPDRHGIISNVFLDRSRGVFRYSNDATWLEAEPVWVTAERQGIRAAAFFWVMSETDWEGTGATYRRAPFDASTPESEKVEQILAWLDLPEKGRPGLIVSWWHGCDSVGHRWGPLHDRISTQLEEQDRALADLLAGLDARDAWGHTTLIVLSDHGMASIDEVIDVKGVLRENGVQSRVFGSGGGVDVFLKRGEQLTRALAILAEVPGVRAIRGDSLSPELRLYHPRRTGDLVVFTDPPRAFAAPSLSSKLMATGVRALGGTPGFHGYDAGMEEMGAMFLAMGRGVPERKRIGPQRVIDVAPTVTRLLGIEPPRHSEGKPILEIAP